MKEKREREPSKLFMHEHELVEKIQALRDPLSVISGAAFYLKKNFENTTTKEARHFEIIDA
ncbi:MAG TPA: hypothetical protein VKM55_13325 [Candidatus Lokiarchaeia archaeon]|nr:hypothetical protein [Candidatus Lokiarchaeia archaeon]